MQCISLSQKTKWIPSSPLSYCPTLLPARQVTISWYFTSRVHPSFLVTTQDIASVSYKLFLHSFLHFLSLLVNISYNNIVFAVPSSLFPFVLAAGMLFLVVIFSACWRLMNTLDFQELLLCEGVFTLIWDIYIYLYKPTDIHAYIEIYIYIHWHYMFVYIYICICVCVCYFFLVVSKRWLWSFCTMSGQK